VGSNCAAGSTCTAGSCGLKPDGAICTVDAECTHAHCADGVCCNSACTGTCYSCNLAAGPPGVGTLVPANQDHARRMPCRHRGERHVLAGKVQRLWTVQRRAARPAASSHALLIRTAPRDTIATRQALVWRRRARAVAPAPATDSASRGSLARPRVSAATRRATAPARCVTPLECASRSRRINSRAPATPRALTVVSRRAAGIATGSTWGASIRRRSAERQAVGVQGSASDVPHRPRRTARMGVARPP
jgi:hypothetical protein